jgi:methylated-DNA-[protein]-cysteine S-methyltransferase
MEAMLLATQTWTSAFGPLWLAASPRGLCACDWDLPKREAARRPRWERHGKGILEDHAASGASTADQTTRARAHIDAAIDWLQRYSQGCTELYEGPLDPIGTAFQRSVWKALLQIPYGETLSYRALAKRLDIPDSVRAVASANGANLLSIVIPCHRVLGSDQSLTGYAGGLEAKRRLLAHEGLAVPGAQGALF